MTDPLFEQKALRLLSGALDRPSGDRLDWLKQKTGDDEAMLDRVLALLGADTGGSALLRTGAAGSDLAELDMPERVGAYRIMQIIGQGGMGAVFKGARDSDDFDLTVAIKIVRPGALSDTLIARFERERQTLAALNHPHIARLYDGGQLPNGSPYMVMEYIEGEPITDWASAQALSLKDRLWLFADLCRALRYAHQNLIIHRDITPSNVMVTAKGMVKLIDFGIAKPHDLDAAAPESSGDGSLAGLSFTPGYAAPERSKGAAANTLSDIYSLGKLLETLVSDEDNEPDIQAIIRRATAIDPAERYPSVDGLLDDIHNFQSGRGVEARSAGALYHAGKFLRRHKYAASTGAAVLVSLIGGLTIMSGLYRQANLAENAAEARFDETRALTGFLINDLSRNLNTIPGTLPLQRKIVETSTSYLDILADAALTDSNVTLDYAKGRATLATLLTQAGGSNLGDPEEGRRHFEESLSLLSALAEKADAEPDVLVALADAQSDYGYALAYHFGQLSQGAAELEASLQVYEKALSAQPDNGAAAINQQLAKQYLFYFSPVDEGTIAERLDKMETVWEGLSSRFPDQERLLPQYASFLRQAANYELDRWDGTVTGLVPLAERSRYETALNRIRQSIDFAEAFLLTEPANSEHIYQLVWSQEIEALLLALDVEWRPSFEDTLAELAPIARRDGEAGIAQMARTDHADRLALGQVISARLDRSDQVLAQLAPFEAGTFTHSEALYYNLKARAYIAGQLDLDLSASGAYLDASLDMLEAFLAESPDFRNALLEQASTRTEKAYLLLARNALFAEQRGDEACTLLRAAQATWERMHAAGDKMEDYAGDDVWTDEVIAEAGCP